MNLEKIAKQEAAERAQAETAAREALAARYDREVRLGLLNPNETDRFTYINGQVATEAEAIRERANGAVGALMAAGQRVPEFQRVLAVAVQHEDLEGRELASLCY